MQRRRPKRANALAAEPLRPQAGDKRRRRRGTFTVVVYGRKRVKTVVLYVGRGVFVFKVPASREVRGVVKRRWRVGGTDAYSARVRARDVAELIDAYAHEEAARKIHMLDPVYRAAALQGYRVHGNKLYVRLWLEHPLGEPLFRVGDPKERELGDCIKHFTHSYGIWRMVTPPWAATC
jgi:hypothetical protein